MPKALRKLQISRLNTEGAMAPSSYRGCGVMVTRSLWERESQFESDIFYHCRPVTTAYVSLLSGIRDPVSNQLYFI